ncbi:unnamed protein product, partial [Rotaria sp. Silwood2]
LDFLFNGFDNNLRVELNEDYSIEISEDSEVFRITGSIHDFIPPSSTLTKLTAAELNLVYHGVRHGHNYISQSCTVAWSFQKDF